MYNECITNAARMNFMPKENITKVELLKAYGNFLLNQFTAHTISMDELSKLYRFLSNKIKENANYNVSTLFDNFEIDANSLIDKVINYSFPEEQVFDNYLKDTIKRVKIYQLEQERDKVKDYMLKSSSTEEQYAYVEKLKEIDAMIKKEKLS
jgi:hypothetical protein